MPPTFFLFLGVIFYLLLLGMTIPLALALLVLDKKQLLKKVIATVIVSFPCFIITTIIVLPFFIIPGLLFIGVATYLEISASIGGALSVVAIILFFALDFLASLYIWYFISKLFYQKIDKKPISEIFEQDSLIVFIKPLLVKLHLFNFIIKF